MLAAACTPKPEPEVAEPTADPGFVVEGARVFDGESFLGRLHAGVRVLVRGGRIHDVGLNLDVPPDTEVVDGRGMTLLPGLIDAHTHVDEAEDLTQALLFGVTTELDMAMDPSLAGRLRGEQQRASVLDRADLLSAGYLATAPEGHGTQYGMWLPTLTRVAEADEWVAERLEEGSDYIKLVVDDRSGYEMLNLEIAVALIEAAHARDALAVAHIRRAAHARELAEAGVDGLAHIMTDELPGQDLVERFAEGGGFVVPTLQVFDGGQPEVMRSDLVRRWLGEEDRHHLDRLRTPGGPAPEAVAELHAGGVTLLAGSDAPTRPAVHGASLHGELEMMLEAGLDPVDVLTAATAAPADVLGLRDRGRIEPGRRADLLLVDGDPADDIRATAAIERIWKAGEPVDRVALREVLP